MSDQLLELAERLASECPPQLGREIAATGSVGATDVLAGEQGRGVWAWCRFGEVEVEPYWSELDWLRREVEAVLAAETTDHARIALGYVLTHCRPLRTEGVLAELGEQLAAYPDFVRRRLIEDAVAGWEIPSPRLGPALRGDRFAVEGFLLHDAERVLRIVFALNRRWEPPRWKWLAYHVSTLEVAPPRLAERVVAVLLEADAVTAVARILELVRETLTLVPDEFDVSAARRGIEVRLARL
jgi:hypothetical protein